jgi:hypothetical protein
MKNEDRAYYADKHKGRQLDEAVAEKIRAIAEKGRITCAAAHLISKKLDLPLSEIGIQIDLMDLRINECQLGLFGYPDGKKLNPDIVIPDDLDNQLDISVSDGRISCNDCWEIADRMKIKKLDIGSACEKKNIRIKPCQLGAF